MRLWVHACQEEHKFNTTPNLDGFNDIRLEKDGGVDASINSVWIHDVWLGKASCSSGRSSRSRVIVFSSPNSSKRTILLKWAHIQIASRALSWGRVLFSHAISSWVFLGCRANFTFSDHCAFSCRDGWTTWDDVFRSCQGEKVSMCNQVTEHFSVTEGCPGKWNSGLKRESWWTRMVGEQHIRIFLKICPYPQWVFP